jgi:hypothetical protein
MIFMCTWEWWITVPAAVTVLLVGGVAACGQTVKPVSGRGRGQLTGAGTVALSVHVIMRP